MSSFWKMQCASTAMQVVVQEHAPAELQAQLARQMQENERLRVQLEDLREEGQMHTESIKYLYDEVIGPALDILEEARRDIRMREGFPYIPDLVQAYNAMCDAEQRLRNENFEDMSEDSEERQGGRRVSA